MCQAPADLAHVYIISRKDIPQPHLSVQVAHAAIAGTLAFGRPDESHPNLVVLVVENEAELMREFERLKQLGVPCCSWREEDMGGAMTGVATSPLRGRSERRHFRHLKLLRP